MNDFQRVLISYPHGNPREKSTAWSNFSWCYIKHDITGIKIYTASANNSETAAMPEITEFQELCTGHSSEIIRVIDLSESTPVYYCLTINQKCLYKLTFTRSDFASGPPFLQDLALQWNPQDSSDPWKSAQHKMSKDIRRLDHHTPLTKINLENFQNQYNQWLATINAVQQAAQNAIVAQTNWLQAERLEPVNLSDTSEGHNALKPEQRTAIQTQVATRLSAIKLISHTKEAYTRALCHILNRQHSLFAEGENEHTHSELHSAVWIDFHIDFLYKTELRGIYPNFYTDHTGNATYQLTRADVHHYTLDLVESELSRHQASCNLELGRERCPESYISQIITTSSYTRQTSVASDKLDELNNTIKQIHHHPELELKARQVYEELHHLHRVARSAELDGIIDLTITLLKPRCIQNPEENLANYMVAAESYSTEHHPSRNWKKLGLAMAILGGVIAALGGGLLLASIIPTTAASILITGGIVAGLTGVSSFFHHRSRIETIEKFAEHVQNAYQY